jgi:hypothetical protein
MWGKLIRGITASPSPPFIELNTCSVDIYCGLTPFIPSGRTFRVNPLSKRSIKKTFRMVFGEGEFRGKRGLHPS